MTLKSRLRFVLLGSTAAVLCGPPSFACSASPADHVFIGQIERVTKRRWGPEDQMGQYENRLFGWRAEGRTLPKAAERVLIYPDAKARVSIDLSLKNERLDQKEGRRTYTDFRVDVDLLRPVRSPRDGLCTSFPMPCPWDVYVGDWVAVAGCNAGVDRQGRA